MKKQETNKKINKKAKIFFVLLLLILVGFFLRLYKLGSESIWMDESYTILDASQPTIKAVIESLTLAEGNPLLNHFLLHFWIELFGKTEFVLRFFYVIFGVLCILLIYKVGKEMFDYKVGIISALILSTSMIDILYSQEIRSYTLFSFLTLCSFLFFTKIIKEREKNTKNTKKPKNKNYAFYIISTALAANTHYLNFFSLFIQNAYVLLIKKNKNFTKKWILSQLAVLLLFIPSFLLMIKQFWWIHLAFKDILLLRLGFSHVISEIGVFAYTIPVITIALILGIFYFAYLKRKNIGLGSFLRKIKFNEPLFLIFLLVLLVCYLIKIPSLVAPVFLTRYSFFIIPFFYIFIAKGITLLKKRQIQTIIIIAIIAISFFSLYTYYTTAKKEQWREAVQFIETNSQENDLLLFNAAYMDVAFDYYYKGDLEKISRDRSKNMNFTHLTPFPQVQEKIKEGNKAGVWLILSHDFWNKGFYKNELDKLYPIIVGKEFKGIKLYYYKIS